jgi:hypothetical protein
MKYKKETIAREIVKKEWSDGRGEWVTIYTDGGQVGWFGEAEEG